MFILQARRASKKAKSRVLGPMRVRKREHSVSWEYVTCTRSHSSVPGAGRWEGPLRVACMSGQEKRRCMRMSRTKPRGGVKEKHEEKAASYQLIAVSGKVRFGRLRGDTGEIRLQPWQNSPTSLNSSLDPSALEPLLLRSELDPNPSCPPTFPHPEQGHLHFPPAFPSHSNLPPPPPDPHSFKCFTRTTPCQCHINIRHPIALLPHDGPRPVVMIFEYYPHLNHWHVHVKHPNQPGFAPVSWAVQHAVSVSALFVHSSNQLDVLAI